MPNEHCVHRLGDRQNGVITSAQLQRCGLSRSAIAGRVKAKRLFPKHRGVYAVGRPDLSQAGVLHAAVLAIGADAVLSHRSAAKLWGFWDKEIDRIEVSVPRRVPSRKQIRVYRTAPLPRVEKTRWWGVPVTTAARAVLDLALTIDSDDDFAFVVHEAEAQKRVTQYSLRTEIERNPHHRGSRRLAAEIAGGPMPTRSRLEVRVLQFLREGDYPRFETNARIPSLPRWVKVDVYFPEHNLVVEADGGQFHDTPYRRRRDARKQAIIEAAGVRVIRLRWEDLAPATRRRTHARVGHALARRPAA